MIDAALEDAFGMTKKTNGSHTDLPAELKWWLIKVYCHPGTDYCNLKRGSFVMLRLTRKLRPIIMESVLKLKNSRMTNRQI